MGQMSIDSIIENNLLCDNNMSCDIDIMYFRGSEDYFKLLPIERKCIDDISESMHFIIGQSKKYLILRKLNERKI